MKGGVGRPVPRKDGRSIHKRWYEVRGLLTDRPRRRIFLIEHLHLIQDQYGYLSAAHLAALASNTSSKKKKIAR